MGKLHYWLLLSLTALAGILLPSPDNLPWQKSGPILRPLPPPPSARDIKGSANEAYRKALQYLREHRSQFGNRRYITVIDYTRPSTSRRFFVIDTATGNIQSFPVTHGKNSGWLYATRFSNDPESFQSSRGFFRTGGKYYGKYGPSLEIHGLEKGINDNAFERRIVIHGADYANPRTIAANRGRLGRSLGCPALPREVAEMVIDKIKNGSLLYVHTAEQKLTGRANQKKYQ